MVATFDKESYIKYAATEINTTLLYVVMRFYPFSMSGILLRRFYDDCDDCDSYVQLNLIDCHIILITILNGCNVTIQFPSTINVRNNTYLCSILQHNLNCITIRYYVYILMYLLKFKI